MPFLLLQSPLVIVDLLLVDSLVIVDRLSRPNVYFSIYFSLNSGFSRYSGQFATNKRIQYYERRLYLSARKNRLILKFEIALATKSCKLQPVDKYNNEQFYSQAFRG